jgi:uncharacterized protein involved in propanediol utilization
MASWVENLHQLQRADSTVSGGPASTTFKCSELLSSDVYGSSIKQVECATRAGNRLLVGTAAGLFATASGRMVPISELKKVTQIDVSMLRSSFVARATKGKAAQLHLFGINSALRGR